MSHSKSKPPAQHWREILVQQTRQAEHEVQTVKCNRVLSVEILVQTPVLGCLSEVKASLADFVQTAAKLGVSVHKSSLDERLTKRLVMLLATMLQLCVERQLTLKGVAIPKLKAFKAVFIIDSTQISVAQSLYQAFAGNATNAKMKIHLVMN